MDVGRRIHEISISIKRAGTPVLIPEDIHNNPESKNHVQRSRTLTICRWIGQLISTVLKDRNEIHPRCSVPRKMKKVC